MSAYPHMRPSHVIPYQKIKLKRCTLDSKLALFSVFSVGLVTVDLGSDSFQADSYIEEGNYMWGYSTITTMFIPFLSVSVYVILNHRKELWKNDNGIWWASLIKIARHIPFVQPFVHFYYLKELMNAKATIDRSLKFYKDFQ